MQIRPNERSIRGRGSTTTDTADLHAPAGGRAGGRRRRSRRRWRSGRHGRSAAAAEEEGEILGDPFTRAGYGEAFEVKIELDPKDYSAEPSLAARMRRSDQRNLGVMAF